VVKAIVPEHHFRKKELLFIDDERWRRLTSHFPINLTANADAALRGRLLECCSRFLTESDRMKEAQRTFSAMQRPGKGQPAGLARLAKGLRMAADAWEHIKGMHDDRVTEISRFDDLEAMAADAERRLAALRALKPKNADRPSEEFVRNVAKCCRTIGLKPAVTGDLYDKEEVKLTWFQKFIVALDDELLGEAGIWWGKGRAFEQAKGAWITKAMRGDGKSGKARK
jgi:hypothetical protein